MVKYTSTPRVGVRAPLPLVFWPKCNDVDYARTCGGRRVAGYGQRPYFIPGTQVGPVPAALGTFDTRMLFLSSSITGMGNGGGGGGKGRMAY